MYLLSKMHVQGASLMIQVHRWLQQKHSWSLQRSTAILIRLWNFRKIITLWLMTSLILRRTNSALHTFRHPTATCSKLLAPVQIRWMEWMIRTCQRCRHGVLESVYRLKFHLTSLTRTRIESKMKGKEAVVKTSKVTVSISSKAWWRETYFPRPKLRQITSAPHSKL